MGYIYGSSHTHIEDLMDAVTGIQKSINSFYKAGMVRVASTGHGMFTQYENVQESIRQARAWADEAEKFLKDRDFDVENALVKEENGRVSLKSSFARLIDTEKVPSLFDETNVFGHVKESFVAAHEYEVLDMIARIRSLDVIPGVEAYFGDEKRHMILIAKNDDGYVELSNIISDSNETKGDTPIVTEDILRRYVRPGDMICTSACIGGIFGKTYTRRSNVVERIGSLKKKLSEVKGYVYAKSLYDSIEEQNSVEKITKKLVQETKSGIKKGLTTEEDYERILHKRALYEEAQDNIKTYQQIIVDEGLESVYKEGRHFEVQIEKYQNELESISEEKIEEENISLYQALADIFGEKDFYFELQNHGLMSEEYTYNKIVDLAFKVGNPNFIAANDIHVCVTKDDPTYEFELEKRNVAMYNRYKTYSPISSDEKEYVIKSDEELKQWLSKIIVRDRKYSGAIVKASDIVENAVSNIEKAMASCEPERPEKGNHYPKFQCEGENKEFDKLVEEGFKRRFGNNPPEEYRKRLDYEKNIIKKMGYASYHLIVQDYARYGKLLGYLETEDEIKNAPLSIEELDKYVSELEKSKGIKRIGLGIGPGRGSAAGSLVCYCLEITDIDPIENGLLFERFLNVERVSMPDIDMDFNPNIREKVYEYCCHKYGEDKVAKIATKMYLAVKGAMRSAGRYLLDKEAYQKNLSEKSQEYATEKRLFLDTADELSKKYSQLEKNYQSAGEKELMDILSKDAEKEGNQKKQDIIKYAEVLSGFFNSYGVHAAAVVMSKDPVKSVVPFMWNARQKSFCIQCEMASAEERGLLKMDFLGLKTLAVITDVIKNPSLGKEQIDHFQTAEGIKWALSDKKIYSDIFAKGLTQGIFQFESPGMKSMLEKFKPESFEDIVLLVAAYRPGPMDYIPEIIAAKWYQKDPEHYEQIMQSLYPKDKYPKLYPVPRSSITLKTEALQKILGSTYGCPIYQEQIMQIFQEMAGYSLGAADVVRRYMSKKKEDKLAFEKKAFIYGDEERGIPGCVKKHGISPEDADKLFEQMMPFAKYGFNKSHAAAYAQIACITAWIKYYRTADFYRSSMNWEDSLDKISSLMKEAKNAFDIDVLAPSLESDNDFKTINEKTVLFGLSKIKGVGKLDINSKTSNVQEFIEENQNVTVAVVQKLAMLGLFDSTWSPVKEEVSMADLVSYYNGSRKAIAKFVEDFGKSIRDHAVAETKAIESGLDSDLEQADKLKNVLDVQREEFFTNFKEFETEHGNGASFYDASKEQPEYAKIEIDLLGFSQMQSLAEKVAKTKLKEMSSILFSQNKDVPSFSLLHEEYKDANDKPLDKLFTIPAVVIPNSVEEKTAQKSGKKYFRAKFMDINGDVIERSVYDNPLKYPPFGYFEFRTDAKKFIPVSNALKNKIDAESISVKSSDRQGMPMSAKGYSFKQFESHKGNISTQIEEEEIDR